MKLLREERAAARAALDSVRCREVSSAELTEPDVIERKKEQMENNMKLKLRAEGNLFHKLFDAPRTRCAGSAPSVFYIPDAIANDGLDREIIDCVADADAAWIKLSGRRLQCWGRRPPDPQSSQSHEDRMRLDNTPDLRFPVWLEQLISELVRIGVFTDELRPDNVLINQYEPHEGIMHHTDGPSYYDNVAILSLGSDCLMTFRHNVATSDIGCSDSSREGDVFSVVLRKRSLLVFRDAVYARFLHGISSDEPHPVVAASCECVNVEAANAAAGEVIHRSRRTSLTFRRLRPGV